MPEGAVTISTDGTPLFMLNKIALTADGVDFANADSPGNELRVATVRIHDSTLDNLAAIIKSSDLSGEEKKSMLRLLREKGAEAIVGKCVDMLFANTGLATEALRAAMKTFF